MSWLTIGIFIVSLFMRFFSEYLYIQVRRLVRTRRVLPIVPRLPSARMSRRQFRDRDTEAGDQDLDLEVVYIGDTSLKAGLLLETRLPNVANILRAFPASVPRPSM